MNDTGEIRRSLVEIQEDQRRQQRRQRERPARLMIWWGWIVAGASAAAAAVIVGWILGKPELVHMRETINPLVLCIGVAGVLIAGLGHVLLDLRRGQEAQRAEWAEATKGLDAAAIGRLAAQLQTIETLLPSHRAAIELNREVMLRRLGEIESQRQAEVAEIREEIAANERQRQADFDQIRDTAGKRLKEIEGQIERLAAGIELALLKAQERAYAAGSKHALDAVSEKVSAHIGPLLTEVVALREVQKDLERDLAAVILRQQGPASGGANVIDIRQSRPESN